MVVKAGLIQLNGLSIFQWSMVNSQHKLRDLCDDFFKKENLTLRMGRILIWTPEIRRNLLRTQFGFAYHLTLIVYFISTRNGRRAKSVRLRPTYLSVSCPLQEDICLLMPVDGVLRLVSGAVLFPQRWHLLEKMGMDMSGIHMPVPLYEDKIGPSVNHFMNRLKVGKPVWRANWTIVDDPTLFQPLNEVGISLKLVIPLHRSKKRWLQWCLWCELWCCFIFELFLVYM